MTDRPRILMLAPDTPHPLGGGGARAYHFAKALTGIADLHLVALMAQRLEEVPLEISTKCASVIMPAGVQKPNRAHKGMTALILNAVKALRVIAAPLGAQRDDLLLAGARNCLRRSEKPRNSNAVVRSLHSIYAAILQTEISFGTRHMGFPPARTMERSKEFAAVLRQLSERFKRRDIDVIWLEHSYLLPFLTDLKRLFPEASVVCNAHNVEFSLHERLGKLVTTARARRWYEIQVEACRRMEQEGFAKCDLVYCCSDDDGKLIRRLAPNTRVEAIPNGVDSGHFSESDSENDKIPLVLFTGSFGYEPNRDAVSFFISEILPLIRKQIPTCRFCIAGFGANAQFKDLEDQCSYIEVASDVPDMREYFRRAWVVVVPLRAGSGTRIKILEAMAMGKAIVSTTLGSEGIAMENRRHICLADTPSVFADDVISLIKDSGLRGDMGIKARQLACDQYDWAILTSRAVEIFKSSFAHSSEGGSVYAERQA